MLSRSRFCSGVPAGRGGMGALGGSGGYRAASTARQAVVGWKSLGKAAGKNMVSEDVVSRARRSALRAEVRLCLLLP